MSPFNSSTALMVIRVLLTGLIIALLIAMGLEPDFAYKKVLPMFWAITMLGLVQQRLHPKPQTSDEGVPRVPVWVPWALTIAFTLGVLAVGYYCIAHYQHPQRQYMFFAWVIPYFVCCILLFEVGKRLWRRMAG